MIELQASKNFRLCYQGSKNIIAERLLKAMHDDNPDATLFVDLFGGGGAMSCYALQCGYNVVYNELNNDIKTLLEFCLTCDDLKDYEGRFWQFVDRKTFSYLRDEYQPKTFKDLAYKVAMLLCYSFGNGMSNYLCNESKELFKKEGHELVINNSRKSAEFWADYYKDSLGKLYIEASEDYYKNNDNRAWRRDIFRNMTLKIEAITVACRFNHKIFELYKDFNLHDLLVYSQKRICEDIDRYCPNIPKKNYKKSRVAQGKLSELKQLEQLEQLQQLERLEQLEQLQRLEQLQQLEQLEQVNNRITFFNLDYRECFELIKNKIDKKKTIIYCDSPYLNTEGYAIAFNHKEYKEWLDKMHKEGWRIYFSEYTNYDNYKELLNIEKRKQLCTDKTLGNVNEKLFINCSESEYNNSESPLLNLLFA